MELSNFYLSSFMVPSYRLVLYRTINPLGSPWWTPPFPHLPIPHDHIPTAIGKTGPMACFINTTEPVVSRKVGHAGAYVLGDCVIL